MKEVKEKGKSDESVAEFSKSFEAINQKRQIRKVSEEGSASPLSGDASSLSSGEFEFHKTERSKSTSSSDSSSNKSEIVSPKNFNESPQTGNDPSPLSNTVVNINESGRPYSVRENEMVLTKEVPKSDALSVKDSLLSKPKPVPKPKPKPPIASKPKLELMKQNGSSNSRTMDRQPSCEKKTVDVKTTNGCMKTGIKTTTEEYSEIVLKETPEVPHQKGVKGISSMFESKMCDVEREKMYAKHVKSVEKKNKTSEKKGSSETEDDQIPPPIPPKIFSSPDSPYNDPGPPDFRPPPPPGANKDIETSALLTREDTSTEEENPYADVTAAVAPKDVCPYSDVDIISRIPTPPPTFKDTCVFSEDEEPSSKENSLYEDVEINLTRKKTSTEERIVNRTSGEVSRILQTPPEKPPPYKPKRDSNQGLLSKQESLPSNSSEKQHLVHEKSLPPSPQFAVVMPGSPRLASAEIKSNSSTDVKNSGSQETPPKPFTGKMLLSGNSSPRPSPPPPIRVSSLKSSPSSSSRSSLNASPVVVNTLPFVPHLNLEDEIQEQIALSSPDKEYALPSFEPPPPLHSQSVLHSPPFGVKPEQLSGNSLAYLQELNERNLITDRESVDKMICPPPPKFSPIQSRRALSESVHQTSKDANDSNLDLLIVPPLPPSNGPPSPDPDDIGFDFLSSLPVEEEDPSLFNVVSPPPSQTPLLPNFSQSTSQIIANPLTNNSQLPVGWEDLDEVPSRDIGATVRENMTMRPLVPPMRKQR